MPYSFDYDLYHGSVSGAPEGSEAHGIEGLAAFVDRAAGHYGLAEGSLGIDSGEAIPNFSDGYLGAAPDMGAVEAGTPDVMFPICPVKVRADKYQIELEDNEAAEVTFYIGDVPEGTTYKILKNEAAQWFEIESPTEGTLTPNSEITVKVVGVAENVRYDRGVIAEIDPSVLQDRLGNGAFLFKLSNGDSVPVTVFLNPSTPVAVNVTGPDTVELPLKTSTETRYQFEAQAEDQFGTPITGRDVVWTLEGAPAGVKIDRNSGLLMIPRAVSAGTTFKVQATVGPVTGAKKVTIAADPAELSSVKLTGRRNAEVPLIGIATFRYEALAVDQYGRAMDGPTVTWTADGVPEGVEVKAENGRLFVTVPSTAPLGEAFDIEKSVSESVKAAMRVTLVETPVASNFDDMADEPWAKDAVGALAAKGIVRGSIPTMPLSARMPW